MAPPDPKSPSLPLSSEYDVTDLASANEFASAKNDDSYVPEHEIVELDEEVIINSNSSNLIQEKENGNLILFWICVLNILNI
jgi:hypothetical protein